MGVPVSNKQTDFVTVGSADIWWNGFDVGHVSGDVAFNFTREYLAFKAANMLGKSKSFPIKEECKITCQAAELKIANLKLAMGVTTNITDSYRPTGLNASLSFDTTASDKWDSITFGGSKTIDTFPLKLEHTIPDSLNKLIIILYKAQCVSNLGLVFKEADFTLETLDFEGLADSSRAAGDQIGIMYLQTS